MSKNRIESNWMSSIVQYSPVRLGNIELLTSSDRVQSSGSPCCRACSIASASCISFNTILLVQPYFALALIQYHAWCSIEVLYIVYSVCARWFYGSVSGGSASLSSESSGGELLVSVSRGCVCVAYAAPSTFNILRLIHFCRASFYTIQLLSQRLSILIHSRWSYLNNLVEFLISIFVSEICNGKY